MRRIGILVATLLINGGCASAPVRVASAEASAPFHRMSEVVVAPENAGGELLGPTPQYPPHAREDGEEGSGVVAFVIDTLGRIERGSLRLLRATAPFVSQSICAWGPRARFRPSVINGQKRRVLVVMPFAYAVTRVTRPGGDGDLPTVEPYKALFRGMEPEQLARYLEERPSCAS